jgi:hypothetical protein
MERWIKINTAIADHWIFQNAERLKWWLDLLFMAQWEDKKVMHDSHLFILKRGQMIASGSFLAERWDVSRPTILKFLHLLEEDGMITRSVLYRQTPIITICNYERYQSRETDPLYTQNSKTFTPKCGYNVDTLKNGINPNNTNSLGCKNGNQVDTLIDTQVDTIVDTIQEYNIKKKIISKEITQKEEPADQIQDVMNYFNEMMKDSLIPHPIKGINGTRRGMVLARLKEYGKDAVFDAIRKASQSRFLNGDNQRGWIADFNWIFKPNNFIKVSEGNYDNKQALITTTQTQADNGQQLSTYNSSGCNQYASDKLARRAEAEAIAMQLIDEGRRRQSEGIPTR